MTALFRVPMHADETLTSWVSRLARANECGFTRQLCLDLGLDMVLLNRGDEDEIRRLAALADEPADLLLRHAVVVGDGDGSLVGGSYFSKRSLRRSKLRFCPLCIGDDDRDQSRMAGTRRYGRTHWMFPQIEACPTHSVAIVQSSHVRQGRHPHDFTTMLEISEEEYPRLLQKSMPMTANEFERYICERLAGHRQHGEVLDELSLSAGLAACELFGVAIIHGRDAKATTLSQEAIREARATGYRSLAIGRSGFEGSLDRIRQNSSQVNVRGGQAMYGRFYLALNENYDHPHYGELRKMIRDYTLSVEPVLNGSDFFGPIEHSPWTSVGVVARETGYPDSTLRKILVELGHLTTLRQDRSEQFISTDAAQKAIVALNDMLTLAEAANILGVLVPTASRFVKDGLLQPVLQGRSTSPHRYKLLDRYSRRDVDAFANSLLSRATAALSDEMTDLTDAAKKCGLKLAELLRLMLDDKLVGVAQFDDGVGLKRLRFDWREIESLVSVPDEAVIDRAKFCKRLLINPEAFAYLVRTGALEAEQRQLRAARCPTWVVSDAVVREFEARYATVATLSKETGVGTKGVGSWIREHAVPLAFPVESVKQVIVERRLLAGLSPTLGSSHLKKPHGQKRTTGLRRRK
ncbi:hypothetical protein ELG88_08380 [Rhizobium leguminosarum]|uniref:TniQ family protein n=1 Tax=Rhizobium leguminosarum TaxID=384 RepID=UPI001031C30A|nr:TniQ family protein [Rhizobium leguminosarum]TBF35230.1 hypothetical protein ELG88_08380 [Rhizobium leguminosarum]